MSFDLPKLPYSMSDLEPHISSRTLEFHHGKHHQGYVTTLNGLVKGTDLETKSLEQIIISTARDNSKVAIFNNAAQVWNHTFFWNSMKPSGGGKPSGDLAAMIDKSFGGYDKFAEQFKQAGMTQFGSGWAWLIADGNSLAIAKTPNAFNPLVEGKKALICCDVWEHAYYLDYQNRRADFLQTFLDKLVNWDFVSKNLS